VDAPRIERLGSLATRDLGKQDRRAIELARLGQELD